MGKTATVLNADPVPGNLLFLPGADTVVFEEDGSRYDVAVVLDCGSPERTGRVAPELRKCPLLVNIDHHRTNGDRGELSLVDPDAAATGLLIHRVLSAMGYDICLDVATNIYVAVLTDTGSFHYSSSSPEAFEVAGEMVRRGVDPWAVAERVYETQSAHRLRLLGRVLDSLEVSAGGKVASITTMRETLREFAAGKDALEGFINYPRSIVGVEVAVSFREEEGDVFRVSFRSKGRVDVSAVAARFGGGGHRNAAGCTVPGAFPDVKRKVLEALAAVLS
jgi:phosphoesterase RecJ-like protein